MKRHITHTLLPTILMLPVLVLLAMPASAWPGDLDTSFDFDGMARHTVLAGVHAEGRAVAQQNGKLIVVGDLYDANTDDYDIFVVRLNADGSLDSTFNGGTGRIVIGFDSSFNVSAETAAAVAVEGNGKIVVAGSTEWNGSQDFLVARFHADGAADLGFGWWGTAIHGWNYGGQNADEAHDMVLQSDGKIVVAGGVERNNGDWDYGVMRLTAWGDLDSTFGIGGLATVYFDQGGNWDDRAYALAMQNDGKIVVAGEVTVSAGDSVYGVTRLTAGGFVDTAFATAGRALVNGGASYDRPYAVGLQSDQKIVMAGMPNHGGTTSSFSAIRFHTNGTGDGTFGNNGYAHVDFAPDTTYPLDLLGDMVIDSSDRIILAGSIDYGVYGHDVAVARLQANGSLDGLFGKRTFGFDGLFTSTSDRAFGMVQQSDGKIVVVGSEINASNPGNDLYQLLAARLLDSL